MEKRECFGLIEEMTDGKGLTTLKAKTGMPGLRRFSGLYASEQTGMEEEKGEG